MHRAALAQRLLERESERGQLHALVDGICAGRSGRSVLEGPAGIGKTRLIEEVGAEAARRGATVLTARGAERERAYPFGVIRQLLEPQIVPAGEARRRALFSEAAALAKPVFDPAANSVSPGDPDYATLHGLYWLLVAVADGGPLLVTVDDMHWADEPSARFLAFLERRLEGLAIAVVVATRPRRPAGADGWPADLAREPRTEVIRPRALSAPAVLTLVSETLGTDADSAFATACWKATGGNPFYVGALLDELARIGAAPTEAEVSRVPGVGPESVLDSILVRLVALGADALALVKVAAVLGDGATLRHAAELAAIEPAAAMDAAEALLRIGLFSDADGLAFVHPIVRTALYGDLSPSWRAERHAQAAGLLARDGAPQHEVAAHLLLTTPGAVPEALASLRRAAHRAMLQGAPEVAATYLRRALEEPGGGGSELLLELGEAEARAGLPGCVGHFEAALRLAVEPAARVTAGLLLARTLAASNRATESVDLLAELADDLAVSDPRLAGTVEAELLSLGDVDLPLRALTQGRRAPLGGDGDSPAMLAHRAVEVALRGASAVDAARLATRALAGGVLLGAALAGAQLFFLTTTLLIFAEAYADAAAFLDEALNQAVAHGSALAFVGGSAGRSLLHARTGELVEAEADARAAADAAQLNAWPSWQLHTRTLLAGALLEQGDAGAASRELACTEPAASLPHGIQETMLLETRGRLRLGLEETEAAVADLLECGRRFDRWGLQNPAAFAWRSSAALGLARLDRPERAAALARDEVARARRWGSPRALGVALRAHALVEGGEREIVLLTEAASVLERSQASLEHARALTDLGAALRRAKQRTRAREPLRAGLQLAHACGAVTLAERAHTELAAAGARPRTPWRTGVDALTPSERRIAGMAASGLPNPAIAQALFVTVKTIEMHLTSTYRKLDISSRAALATALGSSA